MTPSVSNSAAVAVLDDDPFAEENLTDPYPMHERLRDAGPVVWLERYRVWAMARHEHVYAALSDHTTFCSSAGVGLADFRKETPWRPASLLLEADPPDHTAVRAAMGSALSPRTVRELRGAFAAEAEDLVNRLAEQETFDAVTDVAEVYPLRVFPDAVGLPVKGRENLLPYGALAFNAFGPRNALFEAAFQGAEPVQEWIWRHCQRDALAPGGLGARLWEAADAGQITHEQAPMLVRSLLSAGVDTTVFAIGNALWALARHPDQWARLHEDPRLARFAFDEALRFESPVQTFFRTTTREVDVADARIPEGEKVLLFLGAANRDPRKWGDDAHHLDITRKAAGHVAFGMGIHQCVGQPIARMEGELLLAALAARAGTLQPAGPALPKLNNTLKGWRSVPVRMTTV